MNIRDHVERLKAKPEHVRRRIAVGTSVGITGVVAAAWFFTLLFAGTLSLAIPSTIVGGDTGTIAQAGTNADGSTGNNANVAGVNAANLPAASDNSNFSKLLAAVGISTAKPAPPALKVEDAAPAVATATQPTVIPF